MTFNDLNNFQKFQLRKWLVARYFGKRSLVRTLNIAKSIPDTALFKEFGNYNFSEDDFSKEED